MTGLKDSTEVQAVAKGNAEFSSQMITGLQEAHPHNVIYSPFSLSTVLAMAKIGAKGTTGDEIAKVMRFPAEDSTLITGYSKVLASYQEKNENYQLAAANRMYLQTGFGLKGNFSQTIKDKFLAEVPQVDFAKNVDAAKSINDWVEESTQGKIKDLIPADSLDSNTRLVLVNGIYFKGLWADQFDRKHTRKSTFHLNDKDTIQVDMMNKQAKFPYGEFPEINAHAVALPYKGDRLSMIVITPKDKTAGLEGLNKINDWLKSSNQTPESIFNNLDANDKVIVQLPRFKLESTMDLVPILKKMGMSSMFDGEKADFSGIPEDLQKLFVTAVVQKAFVEVNEEGTEAAAATGMSFGLLCMPRILTFTADRPFLFQIVDRSSNFVLFAGRCYNPLE